MYTPSNYKSLFFVLLLGAMLGIGGTRILESHTAYKASLTSTPPLVQALKTNVVAHEEQAHVRLDALEQNNQKLQQEVNTTQSKLQQAQGNNKVLVALVDTLLVRADSTSDTATKLADCDTLQTVVRDLIVEGQSKDSLYATLMVELQLQTANRDSVINIQQQAYSELRQSFTQSLTQQEQLSEQLLVYEHQIKRMTQNRKWQVAGVATLAGIAAFGLLHR